MVLHLREQHFQGHVRQRRQPHICVIEAQLTRDGVWHCDAKDAGPFRRLHDLLAIADQNDPSGQNPYANYLRLLPNDDMTYRT